MISDPFRPFENMLDRDNSLGLLRSVVSQGDDGEIFLERRRSEVLTLEDGRIKSATYDAAEGFDLRAVR